MKNWSSSNLISMIAIYHVAPGKHLEFIKWMADRQAVSESLGHPIADWYVHLDGDSWDYVAVAPILTEAQENQAEAALKQRGLTTGFAAGIELRHFILSHTDTKVAGPMLPSEMLAAAQGR